MLKTRRPANYTVKIFILLFSVSLSGCNIEKSSSHPDIVFVGWDETDQNQLFRIGADGDLRQLTELSGGVIDFAVSPNGQEVVFSAPPESGLGGIWRIGSDGTNLEQIFDCSDHSCSQPVWSPEGNRIIYERREKLADGSEGSSYLWWLALETGKTLPVLEDSSARGMAARFSPDGKWLSYVSPERGVLQAFNFETGESQFFPNEVGLPAVWSPDSAHIAFPNLDLVIIHGDEGEDHIEHTHDYQSATHLFLGDVRTGEVGLLSGDKSVEDSGADWSPRSDRIAFVRRPPLTAAGRQIWTMNPDGSNAQPLLEDPEINYGPPNWSPDGRYLLFQRFLLTEPEASPAIWMFDFESGESIELVAEGMQPQWLVNRQ